MQQLSGNTYANLLPATGVDVEQTKDLKIIKGSPYDEGLSFEDHFEKEVISNLQDGIKNKDPIFIIDLGKRDLQQSAYQKWTVVSNPSFAYLRPWWLSVFSVNLLTLKTVSLTGSLSPGVCPYHFKNSLKEHHRVQKMLTDYFQLERAEVSFVQPGNQPYPSEEYPSSSGIIEFSTKKPISEEWLKVDVNPESKYSLKALDVRSHKFIIPTLILSFLAAALIGLTILKLFMIATMMSYKKILKMSEHTQSYKNTAMEFRSIKQAEEPQGRGENINITNLLKESSFTTFMKNVPRISSFVGFYSLILIKQFVLNSVDDFCNSLFREASAQEEKELKEGRENIDSVEMNEFYLKNLYEKFCFLNHYPERKLSDNLDIFESYGYTLAPDTNSLAFGKIIEKKHYQIPERDDILEKDSLEVFFNCFFESSNLEVDSIFFDEIQEEYKGFCEHFKIEAKTIDPEKFAHEHNLVPLKKERMKLVRKKDRRKSPKEIYLKIFHNLMNILFCLVGKNHKTREETNYMIDYDMIENQFSILESQKTQNIQELALNPSSESDNESERAIKKMMFYPKWWAHEILFIIFHMIVTGALMLPFILLAILYEISYEPYSTIVPEKLISL